MTIDEAIRIKSLEGEEFLHTDPDDIDEADRLSIEALKQIKAFQENSSVYRRLRLPGETKAEAKSNYPVYDEESDEAYRP